MPYNSEQRPITKTVVKTPMTNPGELLKVKLGDKSKYDYLRLFFGGPEGETPFEIIVHRPIGITPLDKDEWVFSYPGEFTLLLAREKDPDEAIRREEKELFKKNLAVAKGLITLDADNVVLYPNTGTIRNDFLVPFKKKVKETVKVANKAISDWKAAPAELRAKLSPSKPDYKQLLTRELAVLPGTVDNLAEIAFSKFMGEEATNTAAEEKFPAEYITLGGVYADAKQIPIPWAKGKGKGFIQQRFAKFMQNVLFMLRADEIAFEHEASDGDNNLDQEGADVEE